MSVISSGRVMSPCPLPTVTGSPSRDADLGRGGRRQPCDRGPRRAGQVRLAVLQSARVQQHSPAGQDGLTRCRMRPVRRRGRRGSRRGVPCHAPSRSSSSRAAAASRRPRSTPTSSASAASTRASEVAVGGSAGGERPEAALPVDERARLLGDRRDGEHDVGAFGDGAVPQLQADDERRGLEGGQCRRRVGQVVEFDATDQQCAQRSVGRRGEDARRVAARRRRAVRRRATRRPPRRARRDRRPACRRAEDSGAAPASSAPRSPARRGTQPIRAPVAAASRSAAEYAPGELASRSPTRMTAPGGAARRCSASSAAASPPGAVAISVPPIFVSPRVANGAIAVTLQPVLAGGLAQPQEDDRRFLFGLEARRAAPRARSRGRRR